MSGGNKPGVGRRILPVSGGSAMMRLLRPIWKRFEAAARDPEAAQQALWDCIAREAEQSPMWGKLWGKSGAPPLAKLPVTNYSDYAEAFDRAFERGGMPTASGLVDFWAESSGTTATAQKRFPFVAGNREQRLAAAGPLCAYMYALSRAEPHIPFRPMLVLANAGTHPPSPTGVPVGYASGYFIQKMPPWARRALAVPWEVYTRPEMWDDWAPLYAVSKELSLAMGLSPGWLAVFHRMLLERMDGYWPYLAGSKSPPAPLPPVKASRRRLRLLERAFADGAPTMRQVWPRMAAALCWTRASAAAQLPQLEPHLGGVPTRDYLYICTEAAITVPLYDGAEGHPVHPGGTLVELLPEDAEPTPDNVLPCWRAEPGQRYEILLTTVNGLIRYRLYDVVECRGWFHRAPRLTFRSKSAFVLKTANTSIPEDDVVMLLQDIGYRGEDDLLLGPHPTRTACTMYVREGSDAGRLADAMDEALRAFASSYDFERNKEVLGPVEAITVPASHPMWDYRTRGQAKSRFVLQNAPSDLDVPKPEGERAVGGDGGGDARRGARTDS